jgi:hypothetical protein
MTIARMGSQKQATEAEINHGPSFHTVVPRCVSAPTEGAFCPFLTHDPKCVATQYLSPALGKHN